MINPVYSKEETTSLLAKHYHLDPDFENVSLAELFTPDFLRQVLSEIRFLEFRQDNRPIMYRRSVAKITENLQSFLESSELLKLIQAITEKKYYIRESRLYRFGHTDYQIIHDKNLEPPGLDLLIDLTSSWNDDFGGFVSYTDGEGEFYKLSQQLGTLSLVNRRKSYHRFVKYVNFHAENQYRYYVFASTEVER